jgi:hypothetical protein
MSFQSFLTAAAFAINAARQDHLATLGLPLNNRSVLEVGAGIGLHTPFFLDRGCTVTVTDGRSENVAEAARRLPQCVCMTMDLDPPESDLFCGQYDVIYCYGLLYHLHHPEEALRWMASSNTDFIVLETIVDPALGSVLTQVEDPVGGNQSIKQNGCRPTRQWVLDMLQKYWGYSYITTTQPNNPDFPLNWSRINPAADSRAIFVGSKTPISNRLLSPTLVQLHHKAE